MSRRMAAGVSQTGHSLHSDGGVLSQFPSISKVLPLEYKRN